MNGSCKCGAVTYSSDAPLRLVNCHCNLCRSINGSAFSTYFVTPLAALKVVGDTTQLAEFSVSDHGIKHFCRRCGTPLYNTNSAKYPQLAMIYFGTAADHQSHEAEVNVFCSSKLDWVDDIAELHSFPEAPQRG